VYVADSGNNKIRKITSAGVVTTLAGSGSIGSADGVASSASFAGLSGVAVDSSGNVYAADSSNFKIRKITSTGVVTTLAGSGSIGSADGSASSASFTSLTGIAVDSSGNVYVADGDKHKIRKITSTGEVTTFAGSGVDASIDGIGTAASFNYPSGLAIDSIGDVYVADTGNNKIRKITPTGVVSTLAGSGVQGLVDGIGTSARFNLPKGVVVDSAGNLYVADPYNNKIRKITIIGN
jgi:sugar lactone lactonase YvrE